MSRRVTYNQIAGQKAGRIEALSDGVFSIAMTLLVLDLKVPAQNLVHSEEELWRALSKMFPSFLSYFLGFMTLGIFWVGQSTQFSFVKHSKRTYAWIHIFFLAVVSLIPFSVAFLNAHIDYRSAIALYWLNILLAGIGLHISFNYAINHHLTNLHLEENQIIAKAIQKRIIMAQVLYAVGAMLCYFNNYLSIGFILLVQLNYALGLTSNR